MRLIGIDYGRARIGVALGDTDTRIASPWQTLERRSDVEAAAQLHALAGAEGVAAFVIGVPRPLADQERVTPQAEEIRRFARLLASHGLPVHEENETLSSALASVQMRERGERGKRDDLAAAAILQTFLERP